MTRRHLMVPLVVVGFFGLVFWLLRGAEQWGWFDTQFAPQLFYVAWLWSAIAAPAGLALVALAEAVGSVSTMLRPSGLPTPGFHVLVWLASSCVVWCLAYGVWAGLLWLWRTARSVGWFTPTARRVTAAVAAVLVATSALSAGYVRHRGHAAEPESGFGAARESVQDAVTAQVVQASAADRAAPGKFRLLGQDVSSAVGKVAVHGPGPQHVGLLAVAENRQVQPFCSASVVTSATRNVIVTAAHCVAQLRDRPLVFLPGVSLDDTGGYVFGAGSFAVASRDGQNVMWLPAGYDVTDPKDAHRDVALLMVEPDVFGTPVQDVTGSNTVKDEPVSVTGQNALMVGYTGPFPDPHVCRSPVRTHRRVGSPVTMLHGNILAVHCVGFRGGSSGGPIVVRPDVAGRGQLVGVIGGPFAGGFDPISASSTLGPGFHQLLRQAEQEAAVLLAEPTS